MSEHEQDQDRDGLEEVVLLFDADGSSVVSEMRFSEFEALVNQAANLEQFAASVVQSAYAVVGAGLTVRGLVFFRLKVDENGMVDSAFNVPLRYLVNNAGAGPDLGGGPVRLACRSQCPVPWHSVNLWEPSGEAETHPAMLVQKTVWRNRLGLKPLPQKQFHDDLAYTTISDERQKLEERLTDTFGEEGKLNLQQLIRQHNQQLNELTTRYRADLQQQQRAYLDQIRGCRDEIQKLKAALRHEQERSRRLQELLRGEP